MKQIMQSFKTGDLIVQDVPPPTLRPEGILIRTAVSLVSAGTERMVVDFAEKNLIQKARARPDLVAQVIDKARREGILNTIDGVRNRLEQPLPLGYSSAGVVIEVGAQVSGIVPGDRVTCAGGGYACHAEIAYIPRNLVVKLPDTVSFEAGAFATLGAIALQGIRQGEIALGHHVAVIGLGLLGQLTVQMLKAAGCRVLGIDPDTERVKLALEMGADDACTNAEAPDKTAALTSGHGFDAVLITAATSSSEPVELAGTLARDRAIIVAVGAFGMDIPRKIYYEKELDFRLSRSYGAGRYDPDYEEKGHDYPIGYVRWTEQRNMEAFVQLLAAGSVNIEPLITHRLPINEAVHAYDVITGKTDERFLAVLLTYDGQTLPTSRIELRSHPIAPQSALRLGMVGAGNFTNAALLPAMRAIPGLELAGIVSGSGLSARHTGDRFGFAYCASNLEELLHDPQINWLAITTRHNLHAEQARAGMQAGKNVFVEKPLALTHEELVDVIRTQRQTGKQIMVGFNRRFAPLIIEMKRFVADRSRPLVAIYRCNAGAIPSTHWTQDPEIGGGRIVGEACHFVDLLQFLIGSPPVQVCANPVRSAQGAVEDEMIITLTFADGSVGTVIYAAGGDKAFGKERIELFGDGKVAVLDDFRSLERVQHGKRQRYTERLRPDKGHREEWKTLVTAIRAGNPSPISLDEIVTTHLATFAALDSMRQNRPLPIDISTFWDAVEHTPDAK